MANKAYLLLALGLAAAVVGGVPLLTQMAQQAPLSRAEPVRQARQLLQISSLLDGYREGEGRLGRAREMLDALLREDPHYAPAHRELARYFMLTGQNSGRTLRADSLRAAELSLKMALNINPHYADAYVLAGRLYQLMRRPGDARTALSKAEALGSQDPWLQHTWADLLIADGDYDNAARRYRRVISTASAGSEATLAAYEGLIRYYRRIGRVGDADAAFRQVIAYAPANAQSHGNYAVFLLCTQDDYEAAIAQSRQALEISSNGAGRYNLAASLYRKAAAQFAMKQGQAAAASVEEAAKLLASPPATVVASVCGEGVVLQAVRLANLTPAH